MRQKKVNSSSPESGFTLIEILLAIAIMATLTTYTAQSIQSALQTSRKYKKRIDESSELRSVLHIMERDINLAFHYRDIYTEMNDELKDKKDNDNSEDGESTPPPPNYTEFKGEKNSLHFTSLSNIRTALDSQESDQAEIGYYIKNCQPRGKKSSSSIPCLWRRLSPFLDEKVDEGGRAIVLLENVKALNLRYVGPLEEESEAKWQERWMTKEGADDKTRDKFPLAVEIELVVTRNVAGKDVEQKLSTIAQIRFPNNPRKEEESENTENGEQGNAN